MPIAEVVEVEAGSAAAAATVAVVVAFMNNVFLVPMKNGPSFNEK